MTDPHNVPQARRLPSVGRLAAVGLRASRPCFRPFDPTIAALCAAFPGLLLLSLAVERGQQSQATGVDGDGFIHKECRQVLSNFQITNR